MTPKSLRISSFIKCYRNNSSHSQLRSYNRHQASSVEANSKERAIAMSLQTLVKQEFNFRLKVWHTCCIAASV